MPLPLTLVSERQMAMPNIKREGKWTLPTHLEVNNNQVLVKGRSAYHIILITISGSFLIVVS